MANTILTKSYLIEMLTHYLEGRTSKEDTIDYASSWLNTDEFAECDDSTSDVLTYLENWDDLGWNFSVEDIRYIRDSLVANRRISCTELPSHQG